ncbi:MAG: hypothetical protein ACJ8C4_06640 [Gemmataceae bacterium]
MEFILGLVDDSDPAFAAFGDFLGPHAAALRVWQAMGFLSQRPEPNRVPSCPECRAAVPITLNGGLLCPRCLSNVDQRHLSLWRFELERLLSWLAHELRADGTLRAVDNSVWQLGSVVVGEGRYECFFCRSAPLSEVASRRLLAFRSSILFHPLIATEIAAAGFAGPQLSLLEVLQFDGSSLRVNSLDRLLHNESRVRFVPESGALLAGDQWMGEVPIGSREYHFMACLSKHQDRFVPYPDLKFEVLRRSGGRDTTDDATFCQKLKGRIKKNWVREIDHVVVTTNRGDGYRLRRVVGTR